MTAPTPKQFLRDAGKMIEFFAEEEGELCQVDAKPVRVMAFKGTKICSEICRKLHAGEVTATQYLELKQSRRRQHG